LNSSIEKTAHLLEHDVQFSTKSRRRHKVTQGAPKGSHRCPKGTPKDGQREPKGIQRTPKGRPKVDIQTKVRKIQELLEESDFERTTQAIQHVFVAQNFDARLAGIVI